MPLRHKAGAEISDLPAPKQSFLFGLGSHKCDPDFINLSQRQCLGARQASVTYSHRGQGWTSHR